MKKELINAAARMAAQWWGERLHSQHADKRAAFVASVRDLTRRTLLGEIAWKTFEVEPVALGGGTREYMIIESDYDPGHVLLKAVRDTVKPDCRGCGGSSDGVLPYKTALTINIAQRVLSPKEGYGNYTAHIPIVVLPEDSEDQG